MDEISSLLRSDRTYGIYERDDGGFSKSDR
jgi:hypothetical protein